MQPSSPSDTLPVTAVILSSTPLTRVIPGVEVLVHVSRFSDAAGLLEQRLASLEQVKTPWFFWLDADDDLPEYYREVLQEACAFEGALSYTNELIEGVLRKSGPYSQVVHLDNALLIHHLAVARTEVARRIAPTLPRGTYAVEPLLYFQMAKEGAKWIDRVGYHWHRRPEGLSYHPSLSRGLVRSLLWSKDHP